MSFAPTECSADYSYSFAKVIVTRTQSDRAADANGDVSTEIIILNLCDLELNDKAFDSKYIISTAEINIARTRWLTILMLFLIIIALYLSAYLKFFCNFA